MIDQHVAQIQDTLPPFKAVSTTLVAAFERVLPKKAVSKAAEGTISMSRCIPYFVRDVYQSAHHDPEFTLRAMQQDEPLWSEGEKYKGVVAEHVARRASNQMKNSTARQARQQIADLKFALSELSAAFGALRKPALEALSNAAPWAFGKTEIELEKYILILSVLIADVEPPDLPQNAGMGQPRKRRGPSVTERVAYYYTALTGKKPTLTVDPQTSKAGGLFLLLLGEVFAILKIDESAEANTRAFIKAQKQASPKNQPTKGGKSPQEAA